MRFIDKAMEIENETEKGLKREEVIQRYCPSSYDLEAGKGCSMRTLKKCRICWNREMPNTEAKDKRIKNEDDVLHSIAEENYNKGFEDGMSEGLTQGQTDAWELAKKMCCEMEIHKRDDIFGFEHEADVMKYLTPQEALAKLKAYEETQNKIEVGDVIAIDDDRVVITKVIKGEPCTTVYGIEDNGCAICYSDKKFKKTGKHIDISSILEQIGE